MTEKLPTDLMENIKDMDLWKKYDCSQLLAQYLAMNVLKL